MLHGPTLPRRKDVTEGEERTDDDHVSPSPVGMSHFLTLGSGRMVQARRVLCALRYRLRAGRSIIPHMFLVCACHTQLDVGVPIVREEPRGFG